MKLKDFQENKLNAERLGKTRKNLQPPQVSQNNLKNPEFGEKRHRIIINPKDLSIKNTRS
ncbi:hypothetical protein UR09_05400 [Candidatus Nitromaritima sp. SCGC AAA799-A02]|nr:hypothetical protein UR09_05400 [Candidatus Nitromaritima sp. SCGC AAA799-A02]KMP11504.1 hypothetical protein UZ36_04195 [Candidatus Nitromaritima sp. SCGC AAA799-C22]